MATARVAITVQSYSGLPEGGIEMTEAAADASNGNRFNNSTRDVCLVARNSGASSRTVTFEYVRRGVVVTQTAVTLAAGKTKVFGPFPPEFMDHVSADDAAGNVYVTASHAEVLLSAVRGPGAIAL